MRNRWWYVVVVRQSSRQPVEAVSRVSQIEPARASTGAQGSRIETGMARQVAQRPIDLPDIQTAGPGALESLGFQRAGQTGVGTGTVNQGIAQIQAAAQPVGAQTGGRRAREVPAGSTGAKAAATDEA